MLRPSYAELMEVLNKDTEDDSEITSRYTIVIAAAKRARQLIDGDTPMAEEKKGKPLSTAVNEIWNAKIKVVPEGEGTVLNLGSGFEDMEDSNFEADFKIDDSDDELDDNEDDDISEDDEISDDIDDILGVSED